MFVVGLTGGMGSGKSTVSNIFATYGVPIIDTDKIARELTAPGSFLEAQIIHHFGGEVVNPRGELDRKALSQKIFNNPAERQWLEACLHPIIWKIAATEISQSTQEYVILVVPLLIETQAMCKVDRVLVVDSDPEIQISRACQREQASREAVLAILNTQVSRTERLKYADDVLDNSKNLNQLQDSVALLHQQYLKEARSKS